MGRSVADGNHHRLAQINCISSLKTVPSPNLGFFYSKATKPVASVFDSGECGARSHPVQPDRAAIGCLQTGMGGEIGGLKLQADQPGA